MQKQLELPMGTTVMRTCGNCGRQHTTFQGIWGCWCDHLAEGVKMIDWTETEEVQK